VRIILNADDFGLSDDTVVATVDAFEAGLLSSATIMPASPATERACAFARSRPEFSFGVHLTLVGDGDERPVSSPEDVPGLVDRAGQLHRTNNLRLRALFGAVDEEQVAREVQAQVEHVQSQGVAVSHVDSHRHLHKYGPILRGLTRGLSHVGLTRVRAVQDLYLRKPLVSVTRVLGSRWRRNVAERFATTDHFYMPATAGDTDWRALLPLLSELPVRATLEIGVHPGQIEEWRRAERKGLAAFVPAALAEGHAVATWNDVEEG
jgi:predicted glycoside hydrolase/deacetylase ChbG (UPF0249 family)